MNTALMEDLTQQAGELSHLVHMAAELARKADGAADMGALWSLRCLLGAMVCASDKLHDECGAAAEVALQGGAA